jgi:lipoprotein-releasing system permease protein
VNATPPTLGPALLRLGGWLEFVAALAVFAAGELMLSLAIVRSGPTLFYVSAGVTLVGGIALAVHAIWRVVQAPRSAAVYSKARQQGSAPFGGLGWKSFVAWRYLLVANRKVRPLTWRLLFGSLVLIGVLAWLRSQSILPALEWNDALLYAELVLLGFVVVVVYQGILPYSTPSLILGMVGLMMLVPSGVNYYLLSRGKLPFLHLGIEEMVVIMPKFFDIVLAGAVSAGIAMFFGTLRAYFTFFTTVPIGGVWIGTAALVIVLSVMGGFESDLREKILGSNAHLQITREDGDFVDWRGVKARIDAMPGVVASTPYAVSEVVVAANNTGANVIIKGIDPATVGKVTDLVSDLEDRDAMKRLFPLVDEPRDLRVPQQPRTGPVIDPPPSDMPTPGEPIDFSSPESRSGSGSASGGSASGSGAGPGAGDASDGDAFGGDAVRVIGQNDPPPRRRHAPPADVPGAPPDHAGSSSGSPDAPGAVVDPPPPDLLTSDEPPTDYSQPDYLHDAIRVIDPPFDTPSISRRTQSLPGILVGRELVKQTHLYTGEEVRVVSPLSDPANPDANGTPIPFNRDYRVAGTFFTGMYEYDLKYVYVTLDSLQDFLDRGDAIDGIEVRVTNPYDSDAFVAEFQAAFGPSYRVQDWKELNRSLFSALKLEKIAMFLVLGIVILVASFSIVGNLIMVVVEKAREIALLKTLGASDAGVMQLFAIQGLMIGLIGTVLGVATGLAGCWGLSEYGFPLNENVYYIDRLPVHVDPGSVLAAAAAGVLISIGATLYPAVVAARVRPAAGMRH